MDPARKIPLAPGVKVMVVGTFRDEQSYRNLGRCGVIKCSSEDEWLVKPAHTFFSYNVVDMTWGERDAPTVIPAQNLLPIPGDELLEGEESKEKEKENSHG